MIDHRLLHGVQAARFACEMLDGDELLPVERGQEHDAAIDGPVADAARRVPLCDGDGAGPTIAFGAAFLRAAQAFVLTEVLEDGPGRVRARQLPRMRPEQKPNCVPQLAKSCSRVRLPA
jgi:hypothetical protein